MALFLAVPATGTSEYDKKYINVTCLGKAGVFDIDVCRLYSGGTRHIIQKTIST